MVFVEPLMIRDKRALRPKPLFVSSILTRASNLLISKHALSQNKGD